MIGPNSRYATCVLYVDGSEEFLGTRPRIDLIAYRYLGRADLWWVICDYNDIFFPLELEAGMVLRIPCAEHTRINLLG